jgi:hypothetical protein
VSIAGWVKLLRNIGKKWCEHEVHTGENGQIDGLA